MPVHVAVDVDGAAGTTAVHYAAEAQGSRDAVLVLAHGAGAGQGHPFMVAFAQGLAAAGVHIVTFNFLYVEQRRRTPDRAPVLESCFRKVIECARALDGLGRNRLFIGGKSMGGRIATHLAAQGVDELQGVIALGYPLHPPGKPEQRRAAHLPSIRVPVLIVQGERDAFGTPSELAPAIETMRAPVTLHVVRGGDHSLGVRGVPSEQLYDQVSMQIAAWVDANTAERLHV